MAARRALLLPWVALVCAAHSAGGSVQIFGEVSFDMRVGDRNEHDNGDEMQKILQDEDSRQQFTESLQIDSIEIKKLEARRDSDVGLSDDDDAAANGTGAINTGGSNSSNTADGGNSYTKYIRNITAAFQEDSCNYQFPERRQTNAMLSNMMNQLTKMFVRLSMYFRRANVRPRAAADKRFTQIPTRRSDFFEQVYFNMSDEFQRASEAARARVLHVRHGSPCAHQRPLRAAWARVLNAAQTSLSRAARRVWRFHLGAQARAGPETNATARATQHAFQFLRRELITVQSEQLGLLCDKFQLCYHELMQLAATAPEANSTTTSIIELGALPTKAPASFLFGPKTTTSSTEVYATASLNSSSLPFQKSSPIPPTGTTTTSPVPGNFNIPNTPTLFAVNFSMSNGDMMYMNLPESHH